MKDLTYIKVKEGKLWASDMHGFLQEFYPSKPSKSIDTTEAFKKSFIEVGNPELVLNNTAKFFKPHQYKVMGREVPKINDGLYPISGLQFEVEHQHCIRNTWFALSEHGVMVKYKENDPEYRKVAILSLKQEQPSEEKEDITWEKLKSIGSKMIFTPIGTPLSASPVEGEKEESGYEKFYSDFADRYAFQVPYDGSDHFYNEARLAVVNASLFKDSLKTTYEDHFKAQASRIKALEDTEYLLLGQACEYRLKIKALEERLEAADDVINRYTKDHGDIEGVYRKAALEKYNKLKH